MDKIINLGIPHIAEQIFDNIETQGLIECLKVSETWKVLAENVLIKRWKGKMFEACQNGETKVVQLLLERCSPEESEVNSKDFCGRTTTMIACENGYKDVVHLLLDYSEMNIDMNARSNGGLNALMLACKYGHTDVVQLLLDNSERNIDLNARSNDGWTALKYARLCRNQHVVQLLLDNSDEKNIDLNA